MPVKLSHRAVTAVAACVAALASLPLLASPASAKCSEVIYDFIPQAHAISCGSESVFEETWTAPSGITRPMFELRGADDDLQGSGGYIKAKSSVATGDEFLLTAGGDAASSISRNGETLLIAESGSGFEPNFISPAVELLNAEEPHEAVARPSLGGRILVKWYDRRPYFNLTEALPEVTLEVPGETAAFSYTEVQQQIFTVPTDVNRAAFELFGGAGESGEPQGHTLVGFEVEPGETFAVEVGGPGEDTTVWRGWFDITIAAGGDTERANYVPPFGATFTEEFYEGGGPASKPGDGRVLVHYWNEEPEEGEGPGVTAPVTEPPPLVQAGGSCVVPQLRGKRLPSARRALAQAECSLSKVRRTRARRPMHGRVLRQRPAAGTVLVSRAGIALTVGGAQP